MTRIADGAWTDVRSQASVEYTRIKSRCHGRAKQRLVNAHRDEYEKYLADEMAKAGIGKGGGR